MTLGQSPLFKDKGHFSIKKPEVLEEKAKWRWMWPSGNYHMHQETEVRDPQK